MKKLGIALVLIMAVACMAMAAPIELKFGHYLVETHAAHIAAQAFADAVSSRTGGQVKVTIFPNSKLGSTQEMLEHPIIGAPFAFKDYAATDRFFAGDFIK